MKAREWARISKPLEEALVGFRTMRWGFVREEQWVAKAISADTSSFSAERFYVHAFVVPLFIPTEYVHFTYGFRVGKGWDRVDGDLVRAVVDALPRLDAIATLPGLADVASDWEVNIRDAELQLAIGVIQDDHATFAAMAELLPDWQVEVDWETEILERCRTFVALVDADGFEAGKQELASRRPDVLQLLR